MTEIENKSLILDLLEWLAPGPRPYDGVMDAWRTSCPRLTIWEDAVDLHYVAVHTGRAESLVVSLTPSGRTFLEMERSRPYA